MATLADRVGIADGSGSVDVTGGPFDLLVTLDAERPADELAAAIREIDGVLRVLISVLSESCCP